MCTPVAASASPINRHRTSPLLLLILQPRTVRATVAVGGRTISPKDWPMTRGEKFSLVFKMLATGAAVFQHWRRVIAEKRRAFLKNVWAFTIRNSEIGKSVTQGNSRANPLEIDRLLSCVPSKTMTSKIFWPFCNRSSLSSHHCSSAAIIYLQQQATTMASQGDETTTGGGRANVVDEGVYPKYDQDEGKLSIRWIVETRILLLDG